MSADRPRGTPEPAHYSYEHYRNPDVAAGFDELRFGGPIGRIVQMDQEHVLMRGLAPLSGRRILDVGTGTGRAALAFARAGAVVTGVDASPDMLAVAEARAREAGVTVRLRTADAHALPFMSREFDAAVSLRVIMHTPDWKTCVTELCRVSDSRVLLDFPSSASVASLESAWRRRQQARGKKVEAYRTLKLADVRSVIEAAGFRIILVHRQFVLPINFHKLLNSAAFTRGVEGLLAMTGLRRLAGSPITIVAERVA